MLKYRVMASDVRIKAEKADGAGRTGLWCWIALAGIIISAMAIRGRLVSIPLERDEGEYAYMAQQMLKGVAPYASAYSMKLPGIDVVYAAILAVFGQTDKAIHTGLIVFNAATIFVIFLLGRRLFGQVGGIASACAYAVMSLATPVRGLSANAEHFIILPALIGILLIHQLAESRKYGPLFAAGLLMGLAFVIKQHGIFFAVFGAVYLLYFDLRHNRGTWRKLIASQIVFAAGIIMPFSVTCLLLRQAGVFDKFWFWTFTYAHKYTTIVSLSAAANIFAEQFMSIAGAMVPIWLLAIVGLITAGAARSNRRAVLFAGGLLVFSFLAVCPGFYFRGHYFIFILPAVAILSGAGFAVINELLAGRIAAFERLLIIILAGLGIISFSLVHQRNYLFNNTPSEVCRMIYGGDPFPESPKISEFIRANSDVNDTLAVLGSEPQIYFYSRRRAATRYIYMYPLMETHDYAAKMQEEMISEIESAKPEILVFVHIGASWRDTSESVRLIFKWIGSYGPEFYNLIGIADIFPENRTIYLWNEQTAGYKPKSDFWVEVYKRRH